MQEAVPASTEYDAVRATEEELDAFMADYEELLAAADAFERVLPVPLWQQLCMRNCLHTHLHDGIHLSVACLTVHDTCSPPKCRWNVDGDIC